jgi:hypothetical protein
MMMDGFDLDSPLVCEGIIGDGCGGGRIFFIKEHSLCVYDPITKESITLLSDLEDIKEISKKGCIIYLVNSIQTELFDLSTIK